MKKHLFLFLCLPSFLIVAQPEDKIEQHVQVSVGGIFEQRAYYNPWLPFIADNYGTWGLGYGISKKIKVKKIPFLITVFTGLRYARQEYSKDSSFFYPNTIAPKLESSFRSIEPYLKLETKTNIWKKLYAGLSFQSGYQIWSLPSNKTDFEKMGLYNTAKDELINFSKYQFSIGYQIGYTFYDKFQIGMIYENGLNTRVDKPSDNPMEISYGSVFFNYKI